MNQDLLNKYINGTASEEERGLISQWAQADKENMKELATLRRLHSISIWNQQEKKTESKNTRHRILYQIASIAAIFAILLGINIYQLKQTTPDIVMQTINVPPGQRVELILADGSNVWLNAGSSFSFPTSFSKKAREVYLDGEAYFNVEKDEKRNFIVKTSAYDIQVLGTTFNVTAYSQAHTFEVSLLKGSVEVYSANSDEQIRLEPNTRVYLANNKLIKDKIVQYDKFLWKDGLISFMNEPFAEMIAKLELYFDTKIIIKTPALLDGKYTGKFRTKDGIEHILRVIQLKEEFVYEKNQDENTITIR